MPDHKEVGGASAHDHTKKLVSVSIDGVNKDISKGKYDLTSLKTVLGVASDRDLDVLDQGKLRPIAADDETHVKEGMEFVSRQPSGGSS